MRLLLDTHALLWFVSGKVLGKSTIDRIKEAEDGAELYISPISGWEISMLNNRGRVVLGSSPADFFRGLSSRVGIRIAELSLDVAIDAGQLPDFKHGDPADRLLIASARATDATLVTRDKPILAYAEQGHVRAIPC